MLERLMQDMPFGAYLELIELGGELGVLDGILQALMRELRVLVCSLIKNLEL